MANISLARPLVHFVLGVNVLVQLIKFFSVEFDILEEQVHMIEAIYGRCVIHNIRPVSDSHVLGTVMMQRLIVTYQNYYETELQHHYKECDEEALPLRLLSANIQNNGQFLHSSRVKSLTLQVECENAVKQISLLMKYCKTNQFNQQNL